MTQSAKKNVLIIGCGYAGRSTAMLLDNEFNVRTPYTQFIVFYLGDTC